MTPEGIKSLEYKAIDGAAGRAVQIGKNVKDVAAQYGIFTPELISSLERMAVDHGPAGNAVKAGKNAQEIALHYGISGDRVLALEELSVRYGPALSAARAGKNLREIFSEFGIDGIS